MATYIHELKDWPASTGTINALAEQLAAVRHRQGRLIGRMEASRLQASRRGRTCESSPKKSSNRARSKAKSSTGSGALLPRAPSRHRYRRAYARRPQCRRRRRDDARRYPEIRRAAHGRAAVRLACRAVSDRPQRHEQNHGRSLAQRQSQARCRSSPARSDASASISKRRRADARRRNERLPRLVQRRRRRIDPVLKAGARPSLVRDHPSVRRRQRPHRARHRRSWRSRARSKARNASTACRRKSGRSGTPTTISSRRRRKATSISRLGWNGFWLALTARSTAPRPSLRPCSAEGPLLGKPRGESFNDRQRKIINRLLDGFEGKLTSSKWAKLTKCSQDTALARHRRSCPARHPGQGRRRRTQHQLFACGNGKFQKFIRTGARRNVIICANAALATFF